MKENKLLSMSQDFAKDVLELCKILNQKHESSLSNQIKRSSTSISANISEANYPQSRVDMISKFEIALKEASETENWLTIFNSSGLVEDGMFKNLHKRVVQIKILLIKSIKTLKSRL